MFKQGSGKFRQKKVVEDLSAAPGINVTGTGANNLVVVPKCNFCQSTEFAEHMGRAGERCAQCGSLRRHRIAKEVYQRRGMFEPHQGAEPLRVLHIDPEYLLRKTIGDAVGGGYVCASTNPEAFGKAKCLKLEFPKSLDIFPDDYFDYVIHNHVFEQIPGSYRSLLEQFARIVKPLGYHIFSVPGPNLRIDTVEGGEFLRTDAERIQHFGRANQVRKSGKDLPVALAELPNGKFTWDNISSEDRAALNVEPYSNRFLVWRKDRLSARAK